MDTYAAGAAVRRMLPAAASLLLSMHAPSIAGDTLPSETPAAFVPRVDSFDYVKREVMIPMRDGVKLQNRHPHSARRASRTDLADPHALRRDRPHHQEQQRAPIRAASTATTSRTMPW